MQEQLQPNRLKQIRLRLGLTQQEFADMLGVSQGNVGHYELRDQVMPPHVARDLIEQAAKRGHRVTYEDIYGTVDEPVVIARFAITRAAREINERRKRHCSKKGTPFFLRCPKVTVSFTCPSAWSLFRNCHILSYMLIYLKYMEKCGKRVPQFHAPSTRICTTCT